MAARILCVEDNPQNMRLVRKILKSEGYTVLEAENGIDALSVCERHSNQIHLIVTDVVMPMMNGDELAERLRRTRPETKIIFMSGYADEALNQHRVLETGIPLMQKPFTPDALLLKIREELDAPELLRPQGSVRE